ncbi:SDR family NAD(P)-dependent oxidoreductase [Mycobacterium spongiae]|uniref:SDR family NAD(P)-dependent oxidoreductase n=2 Tax=Mycobacterium spongiae TaxID=886343 RepID=A0A975PZG2_9MYCO|nr:SDR family NAD(P)-dependent oxidoreductase [Mycobacterium spongiae]
MSSRPTALVTGGSSGIGEATAMLLAANGFTVYAAARRVDRMRHLEQAGIHVIALDVTDDESTRQCVQTIVAAEGAIDVLVNNAGYGSYGAIEDVSIEEARRQFEVNMFGLARITQLVLPGMRDRRSGTIINISSMGGKIYTPFGGWYHATKHALEGWSDCLRLEVKPFGIDVAVIEPGGIKTEWGTIAADNLAQVSAAGAYAGEASETASSMHKRYQGDSLSSPNVVAKAVLRAATAKRPRTRYAVGYMAKPSILMRRFLSDRAFDFIIARAA